METETITLQEPECLEDLDLLQKGDKIKMQIGDNLTNGVYYRKVEHRLSEGVSFELLDPTKVSPERIISLRVQREDISAQNNMINIMNPKAITWVYYYNKDSPLNSRAGYTRRMEIINRSGLEK